MSTVLEIKPEVETKEVKFEVKFISIKNYIKSRDKVRLDLAIQRNSVWGDAQKSLLHNTFMINFPSPVIYMVVDQDGDKFVIEGKQRSLAIFEFFDNKLAITLGTPAVAIKGENGEKEMFPIEGLFFKDLPKELQNKWLNYNLSITEVVNATDSDIQEIFKRLNGGTALTKMELLRADLGVALTSFVNHIASLPFFHDFAFIADKARNRFVDQEMIFQTLMLVMLGEDSSGTSLKEIEAFVLRMKARGIEDETRNMMEDTAKYLELAFRQFELTAESTAKASINDKILKKIHIPILFVTALEAIVGKIEPVAFGLWAKKFLVDDYKGGGHSDYSKHTISGSAKKAAVQGRMKVMGVAFKKDITAINANVLSLIEKIKSGHNLIEKEKTVTDLEVEAEKLILQQEQDALEASKENEQELTQEPNLEAGLEQEPILEQEQAKEPIQEQEQELAQETNPELTQEPNIEQKPE